MPLSGLTFALVSGTTYRIGGLGAFEGADGNYALTIGGAVTSDAAGNTGTGTQMVTWTVNTAPPSSTVSPLPKIGTNLVFPVTVTGTVPTLPTGSPPVDIASFNVYVSVNGGGWTLWEKNLAPSSSTSNTATVNYTGASNTVYAFYSVATDTVGNSQAYKPTIEASTNLPHLTTPATQVASSSTYNGDGTFTLNLSGTDANGNGLAYFEVYVAIGAQSPALIGPAIPAGVAIGGTYSASTTFVIPAADYGLPSNDYRFYSVGIDAAGREEPMHTMYDAMIPDVSYSEPSASQLSLSSITVENGAAERSYIRYIDVNFNDATSGVLQAIINSVNNNTDPELSLTQYSLQDTGPGRRCRSRTCCIWSTTRSRSTSVPAESRATRARTVRTGTMPCRSLRRPTRGSARRTTSTACWAM